MGVSPSQVAITIRMDQGTAFAFHGSTVPEIPSLATGSQSLEIVLALYKEQNLGMLCICPFFFLFLSENSNVRVSLSRVPPHSQKHWIKYIPRGK